MDWIEPETLRFFCPNFADELIRREAFEGLQPAGEVVGRHTVGGMSAELVMALVIEAFDGRILDGPVHALDLPVIRYVICGAFSSCCSCFGTALW